MRKLSLLVGISLFALHAFSQPAQINRCGTDDYMKAQLQSDPTYAQNLQAIEAFTANYIAANHLQTRSIVTVPVVVHVIWNKTKQNIADAVVQSQIAVLNQDYSRTNSDTTNTPPYFKTVAANCQVQFCLASRDPSGKSTTGIRHVQTSVKSFNTNDNVKFTSKGGDDAWPSASYLNIWVCNLGQNLLGYSTFPGGPSNKDGSVILYSAFGYNSSLVPYNLGRTTTHELGHWMNCYHIWGDDGTKCTGSDKCDDTPNQGGPTYGCPSGIQISCTNGPNGNMYQNYMDYSDDNCMNIFTMNQSQRMQANFATGGARISILSSLGCVPPGPNAQVANDVVTLQSSVFSDNTGVNTQNAGARVISSGVLVGVYPNPSQGSVDLNYNAVGSGVIDINVYDLTGHIVFHQFDNAFDGENDYTLNLSVLNNGIYFAEVRSGAQANRVKFMINK